MLEVWVWKLKKVVIVVVDNLEFWTKKKGEAV